MKIGKYANKFAAKGSYTKPGDNGFFGERIKSSTVFPRLPDLIFQPLSLCFFFCSSEMS